MSSTKFWKDKISPKGHFRGDVIADKKYKDGAKASGRGFTRTEAEKNAHSKYLEGKRKGR